MWIRIRAVIIEDEPFPVGLSSRADLLFVRGVILRFGRVREPFGMAGRRSASGDTAEGIPWIEQGIRDYRATGSVLGLPRWLAKKAEALYLADRPFEALGAINEADAIAERFEQRYFSAELHRLRGVFLTAIGVDEAQIETSFCEAIRIAKQQKSVSLEKPQTCGASEPASSFNPRTLLSGRSSRSPGPRFRHRYGCFNPRTPFRVR